MLDGKQKAELFQQLETKGVEKVKEELAQGVYGVDTFRGKAPLVKTWVTSKEAEKEESKRAEGVKIAREANDIARAANKFSIIAIIVAVIATIISVFKP